jgi:tRNA threonylcarbamoyladenosine biosynthesis protein TsaE
MKGRGAILALFLYIRDVEYISKSLDETKEVAEKVLAGLKPDSEATVLALTGDLGSGKTTFSQFVGELLGVRDAMQSPTFLIQKIYELSGEKWQYLVHIDTYRLEEPEELLNLGWEKMVKNPGNIVLVEWADRAKQLMPKSAIHIVFSHAESAENSNERRIEVGTL